MNQAASLASQQTPHFNSPWWLPDGHSQTLWRKLRPAINISQRRQRIELADGDFIDLDWVDAQDSDQKPIALLLHGLCGCSKSPYIQSLQHCLKENNYSSVAMNFRGCSGEMNRLARAYHSGVSEDVEAVITQLSAANAERKFVIVGFSLGANVSLKWLAQTRHSERVHKAVAVSTPFSLALCSHAMGQGISKFYGKYFLKSLRRDMQAKKKFLKSQGLHDQLAILESCGDLSQLSTIWEFDDSVTAPLHGFSSAQDYYDRCSSLSFLASITTNTLLIQSNNDPIIPAEAVPKAGDLNANTRLELTASGGHVGFVGANTGLWLERRVIDFIEAD
ncbi:MAG: hydrolase [SAR86 cluster bacterium]|uniref:Hydrolase n=1 Tax=SAR86 cluster bacterium TaxID=2030880 RepID=A0A2A4MQV1_9GAMM|nr:MAG: hydrolase [SAR86 cluster bacterium]